MRLEVGIDALADPERFQHRRVLHRELKGLAAAADLGGNHAPCGVDAGDLAAR